MRRTLAYYRSAFWTFGDVYTPKYLNHANCEHTETIIRGLFIGINKDLRGYQRVSLCGMPPKTRSGRSKSTNVGPELKITVGDMAANVNKPKTGDPECVSDTEEPTLSDVDDQDDQSLLKKILKNQKITDKKIEKRFSKLDTTVSETKKSLDTYVAENNKAINNLKDDVKTVFSNLETLNKDMQDLKDNLVKAQQDLDQTRNKVDNARKELKEKTATLEKLDHKYVKDEELHKRCLLIVDGVKEMRTIKAKSQIASLLDDLDVECKDSDIKAAFRIGPIRKGVSRPRSIKVEFASQTTKGEIFKNIDKTRALDSWKGVFLSDSLSPEEQRQQKDLRCIHASAKSRGIDVKLRGKTLIIEGKRYTYSDIEQLPHGLTMESVKLVKVVDGYAFQSHYAFLSNMYPCIIKFEGEIYKSSEHLYTAMMARHHNRLDLIPEIINARDGYDAKRIARKITINDSWDEAKVTTMKMIVALKFDQNDNLRDRLLNLKGYLYEATKGDIFSCGMVLSQLADISKDNIPGKNVLGNQLCEYRDNILTPK